MIDRFCAIEGHFCQRFFVFRGPGTCFLAYPSSQPWRDVMNFLAADLRRRGNRTQTWENVSGAGPIFTRVCKAIHANDVMVAEVTELNPNVLFEVGYALAVGRDVILLSDRNRGASNALGLLQTFCWRLATNSPGNACTRLAPAAQCAPSKVGTSWHLLWDTA